MSKKILVTGGAGYIGSSLINFLIKKNFKIINIDNLSNNKNYKIIKNSDFKKIDITNKKKLEKIFQQNNIETVFHLAAKLKISESQKKKQKYFYNNFVGSKTIVKLCKKFEIKNFIFASSCSVYGSSAKKISENKKLNPISNYAKSKKKAEDFIIRSFSNSNINYAILRYFNVVGANLKDKVGEIGNNDHIIKNFSYQLQKKNSIFKIYGTNHNTSSGTCVRDYIFIEDLNNIHFKILKKLRLSKKKKFIVNCGTSVGYSVNDIYNIFIKKTKNYKVIFNKKRDGDIAKAVSNNKRLKNIIGKSYKFKNINYIINNSYKWEKYLYKLSIKN